MILNLASDGVLSILLVLRRALIAYGPMPRQRLLDLCAPLSLKQGIESSEPHEANQGEPDGNVSEGTSSGVQAMTHKTLTRWCQVGLFIEASDDEQTISLAPGFEEPGLESNDMRPLRTAIRRLVLDPRNNLDITAADTKASVAGVCADFTRALTWVLAQDVFAFPGAGSFGPVHEIESDQFRGARGEQTFHVFQNPSRWAGLRAWAPFLGFGWRSPMKEVHLVFDPTEAIADELPDVFGRDRVLPVAVFAGRLAERLPVLDGGTYRLAVERVLQSGPVWRPPAPHELSTALSRALVRLWEDGALRLENRSDAPDRRVLLGRDGVALDPTTHVEWVKES